MYKIEKKPFGYYLTFSDFIKADEMAQWVEDSKQSLINQHGDFGVFVDMRSLMPLPEAAQNHMVEGQKLYKQKGMQRSVVILNSAITTMQFKRIAKETGIYEWERYIDASTVDNWEAVGIDWLEKAIDPDK